MYELSKESVKNLVEANNLLQQLEIKGSSNVYILFNIMSVMQTVLNELAESEKNIEVNKNSKEQK